MFEFLTTVISVWLMVKAVGLSFKLTWGMAKIAASVLMVIAMPVLFVCVMFVGGIALLVPIGVIGLAVGILKACE